MPERSQPSHLKREIRGWLADKLVWWAYSLDPDRFTTKRRNATLLDGGRKRLRP